MFINPFLAGVIATILVELVIVVAYSLYRYDKEKKDE